jgi:hypothetical protein
MQNILSVSQNSESVYVVTAASELYSKRVGKKGGDWRKLECDKQPVSSVLAADDALLLTHAASGKLMRLWGKPEQCFTIPTIRVKQVALSGSGLTVVVLAVAHNQGRIFSALHPEPVLKLATPRLLFFAGEKKTRKWEGYPERQTDRYIYI